MNNNLLFINFCKNIVHESFSHILMTKKQIFIAGQRQRETYFQLLLIVHRQRKK